MTRLVVLITGSGRNVGKTLLGEWLVRLASSAGLTACAVKHVHHGVDFRVKDTGRYLAAGATRVYAIGPEEVMLVERGRADPLSVVEEASRYCNLVVVEGFRGIAERLAKHANVTICIGYSAAWCNVTLEPGFEPRSTACRILGALGVKACLEPQPQ